MKGNKCERVRDWIRARAERERAAPHSSYASRVPAVCRGTSVSTIRWLFCMVSVMMLPLALLALVWLPGTVAAEVLQGGPEVAAAPHEDEPSSGACGASIRASSTGVTVNADSLVFS